MALQNKPLFDADAAEEYFVDLLVYYRDVANDIFKRDNEGRHAFEQTYSAEYQKFVGMQSAMKEVLDYFSKFELKGAPAIEPKSQWIPLMWRETTDEDGLDQREFPMISCGELPENGQGVLVTDGYHVWSDTFFDDCGLYLDSGNDLFGDVLAWMPLPEPCTAKVEDDDNARRVKPPEFDRFKNDTLKDAQPTTPAHWEKADIPLPYQMRTVPTPSRTVAHREMYVCSACGEYSEQNTRYCPNCGAKMDKEVNDDD